MAEGSPQGKREALIRLVKDRMGRPEYADSPSATLVHNFFLSQLTVPADDDESGYPDESVITHGVAYEMHLISKDNPWSDDGTPEGIRREILRILDSLIEQAKLKERIYYTFFHNTLHIARENGCIQATIVKEETNRYVVTLEITFPSVEREPVPLATAGKTERRSSRKTTVDAPPPPRALSRRRAARETAAKEAKNVIALSEERERRKPVRERLAHIVKAHLARCEEEGEVDTALLNEAAFYAVALQDRQAAQRIMEWECNDDPVEDDPIDLITVVRLILLAGKTESVREKLTSLEEAGAECYETAALIAVAIPEPEAARRLIPKLEAEGFLRMAAFVTAKIGDRESALRMMQRAKDQGIEVLNEKTLGAFSHFARFDTQLAKEVMDSFAGIADRDDLDDALVGIALQEACCIAMALGERSVARRMADAIQKQIKGILQCLFLGCWESCKPYKSLCKKWRRKNRSFGMTLIG